VSRLTVSGSRELLASLVLPFIVLLMNVKYFTAGFFFVPAGFGFTQLGRFELGTVVALWVIVGLLLQLGYGSFQTRLATFRQSLGRVAVSRNTFYVVLSVVSTVLFFSLRTNFVNPDALGFPEKFKADVPLLGAHLKHDELLELLIHSKFWQATNAWFGWSVRLSYQVLSSLAGGIFVFTLLKLAEAIAPTRRWLFVALVASGGFMQLFFGEFENYTLVNTCLLIYVLCAYRFLQGRVTLVVPAAVMALAMTFHLLAGWLLPSLLVLAFYSLRSRPARELWSAVGAFFAVLVAVVVFAKVAYGLPISAIYYGTHAMGHGGNVAGHFFGTSYEYYVDIFNLLFLLFPGTPVLVALLASRRLRWEPFSVFLGAMAASVLLFLVSWRALIGVYNDWNLFAVVGLVLSLFCWHLCLQDEAIASRPRLLGVMALTFGLHSYGWILYNHSRSFV
jgi:hypothetical protein